MTLSIEISKINLFGYSNRLVDPCKIDRYIDFIQKNISINPPQIAPYKEGFFCIEGLHRVLSFKYLGYDKIKCIINSEHNDIRLEMLKIAKNSFSELSNNCKTFLDAAIINSYEDGLSKNTISDILEMAFTPINSIIRQHFKALKDDKIEKGKNLILQGYSFHEVAKELGVRYSRVRTWSKYYDEVVSEKIDANKQDIIKLAIKGYSHLQIAEQVKIPSPYIRKWFNNQSFDFDTLLNENKITFIKGD